ncbi:DUF6241 domain-containing protein [Neobacillus dielmonensis]|uniref:DUF6241 domain-containing protein n=1 Tax=Neobacillus dielmonensis TaxID=1347369 RepID=UPI0005AB7297|nr:DUF6241 domain-containing protein [Neobacillus dielmonensis]
MRKVLMITAIVLAVLASGSFGVYKIMDNASGYEEKQEAIQADTTTVDDAAKRQEEIEKQQTAKIGGIQYDIGIDQSSSQKAVIEVMHKMTHQKVKAEDKWGAIPMIPDTINKVYEIVNNSQFELKEDLLGILDKWKNGNFASVDTDHNYFWRYQDGTVGKAYGIMSKSEEKTFVINNYGQEYLADMGIQ